MDSSISNVLLPRKNELWWVKMPNSLTLIKMKVMDITPKTITLSEVRPILSSREEATYRISDIQFVESTSS